MYFCKNINFLFILDENPSTGSNSNKEASEDSDSTVTTGKELVLFKKVLQKMVTKKAPVVSRKIKKPGSEILTVLNNFKCDSCGKTFTYEYAFKTHKKFLCKPPGNA